MWRATEGARAIGVRTSGCIAWQDTEESGSLIISKALHVDGVGAR
jgi:hypothetical protein